MTTFRTFGLGALFLFLILSSCGKAEKSSVSSRPAIPPYPNAIHDQSIEKKGMGQLERVYTHDSFYEVVQFYSEKLEQYDPNSVSHTSELGRQMAITFEKEGRTISVAIQGMEEENMVFVTYMTVGF